MFKYSSRIHLMRKSIICCLFFTLSTFSVSYAQDDYSEHYAQLITEQDLRTKLNIVAQDSLEGRKIGSEGLEKAAQYIRQQFVSFGLTSPGHEQYAQSFDLFQSTPGNTSLRIGRQVFSNYQEIIYGGSTPSAEVTSKETIFVGTGSDEDISLTAVSGKAVIIVAQRNSLVGIMDPWKRLSAAGASVVLVYCPSATEGEFQGFGSRMKRFLSGSMKPTPPEKSELAELFFLNKVAAQALIINSDKLSDTLSVAAASIQKIRIAPKKIAYSIETITETIGCENVLGFLEGTDKKEEVLVITAHYDHIGKNATGTGDLINNGADDDGSGTVAVIQMAKAFSQAKKEGHGPRRSILFMTVTAEEVGLLGSAYYTSHPVLPLENTVVNLNMDMIGRHDPEHDGKADYVYVIGSDRLSTELHQLNESNNSKYTKLVFDYTYNDENHPTNLYKRSDHWNFAKHGIPIVFYFDGVHADYHRPSDEVSKIDFKILAKRTQCVFHTAWDIANRDQRLIIDK